MFVLHQYPIYRWARGIVAVMGVVRGGIWRHSCNPAHPAWGGSSGGRAIVGARRVLEITAESVLGGLGHYGTTSQGRSLATRPPHGQQTASRAMKSLMEDDPDWQELGECTLQGVALESGSLAAPAKRLRSEEQVLRNRAIQAAYRARKKVGRTAAQPCTLVGGLARAGCGKVAAAACAAKVAAAARAACRSAALSVRATAATAGATTRLLLMPLPRAAGPAPQEKAASLAARHQAACDDMERARQESLDLQHHGRAIEAVLALREDWSAALDAAKAAGVSARCLRAGGHAGLLLAQRRTLHSSGVQSLKLLPCSSLRSNPAPQCCPAGRPGAPH